jgi:hypothetical protein
MFDSRLFQQAMTLEEGKTLSGSYPSNTHNLKFTRSTARSGLRIDLATLKEPTVFSKDWKCGDSLKPVTKSGKTIDQSEIQVCKIPKIKRSFSAALPQRNHEYRFFEKRDGLDCNSVLRHHKRQGMGPDDNMPGMTMEIPQYNTIKLDAGQTHGYARIPAAIYNEQFYTQASASGLMTVGAQHGVCRLKRQPLYDIRC